IWHVPRRNAQPRAIDVALGAQLVIFLARQRAGNRKADALIRRTKDRGVDAHDLSLDIHKRTAAVARIHGRIGLQIFLIRTAAEITAAATRLRTNNAKRQAAIEPVWTSQRPNQIAYVQLVAITPLGGDQIVQI